VYYIFTGEGTRVGVPMILTESLYLQWIAFNQMMQQ